MMKEDTCATRNAKRGVRKKASEKEPDLLLPWEQSRARVPGFAPGRNVHFTAAHYCIKRRVSPGRGKVLEP